MSHQEPTAAERLPQHLAGRADTLADLFDRMAEDDYSDEAHDEYHNLPLSVEVVRTIKVLLSTGGPADGLTIELDADGDVSSVRYWFADWFDHADTTVSTDSPLYRYAEDLAEMVSPEQFGI